MSLVLKALRDRILDTGRMRALGFCVSIAHADYMARRPPNVSGLPATEQRILTALHFALWSDMAARKTPLQESMERLWQHPAIREELLQLLACLEDRASTVPTPLGLLLGWPYPVPPAASRR